MQLAGHFVTHSLVSSYAWIEIDAMTIISFESFFDASNIPICKLEKPDYDSG